MYTYKVGLVNVGENLPLDIQDLADKLNSIQSTFHFEEAGVITAQVLGNPDVYDEWYDIPNILQLLSERIDAKSLNLVVGITESKITNKVELSGKPEIDYFSMSDFNKFSILSVNSRVLKFISQYKDIKRYVAHLMMGELLVNLAKENLSHLGQVPCALNECEDRITLDECIKNGQICSICIAKLKEKNVGNFVIESVMEILSWCRRNTWSDSFQNIFRHPIPSLGFGIGFGWFSTMFITKEYYPIPLAFTIIPAIFVFVRTRLGKIN